MTVDACSPSPNRKKAHFPGKRFSSFTWSSTPTTASWKWPPRLIEPFDCEERTYSTNTQQLGLKLDPAKGPNEFLVIDHLGKPSGN